MTDNINEAFSLPVGRVINASLFEKDTFTDTQGNPGTPSYKIELVFNPEDLLGEGTEDVPTVEDMLYNAAEEKWGKGAGDDCLEGRMRSPLLDGNKLAARREKKGKPGEAYEGKLVIRAHTLFNKDGDNATGGIQVWDENVKAIDPVKKAAIYPGCFGVAAVTIGTYTTKDNEGDEVNAMMFYLSAFQKTEEADRLSTPKDTSTLFRKVGRSEGSKKRTRKG